MRTNRNRSNFGVMLLLYQIFGAIGIDNIPPVTCFLVGLQTVIYLRLVKFLWYRVSDVCISVQRVWYAEEWERLIFGALEHADDMHLYYNMISLVWKGMRLERMFGKFKFLYIVAVFTVLTSIIMVALSYAASLYVDPNYQYQCAVGFSGVIFALKVLVNNDSPATNHYVFGMTFPTSYAVWAELLVIQLITPNASFIGHLAGIIVGLLYTKGPLKPIMDVPEKIIEGIFSPNNRQQWSYYGDGRSEPDYSGTYRPSFSNGNPYSYETGDEHPSYYHPSNEELRTRRLYRFSGPFYR